MVQFKYEGYHSTNQTNIYYEIKSDIRGIFTSKLDDDPCRMTLKSKSQKAKKNVYIHSWKLIKNAYKIVIDKSSLKVLTNSRAINVENYLFICTLFLNIILLSENDIVQNPNKPSQLKYNKSLI